MNEENKTNNDTLDNSTENRNDNKGGDEKPSMQMQDIDEKPSEPLNPFIEKNLGKLKGFTFYLALNIVVILGLVAFTKIPEGKTMVTGFLVLIAVIIGINMATWLTKSLKRQAGGAVDILIFIASLVAFLDFGFWALNLDKSVGFLTMLLSALPVYMVIFLYPEFQRRSAEFLINQAQACAATDAYFALFETNLVIEENFGNSDEFKEDVKQTSEMTANCLESNEALYDDIAIKEEYPEILKRYPLQKAEKNTSKALKTKPKSKPSAKPRKRPPKSTKKKKKRPADE